MGTGIVTFLLPIILIFGFFYLLIIRPDKKRKAALAAKVNSIKVGDKVSTFAGIIGRVQKIDNENKTMTITSEGSRLLVLQQAISDVLEKVEED